jgi:beta-apo-4'-carotenal oxygenase
LRDNEAALVEACKQDLGKSNFETFLTEINWCQNDIVFVCNNLKKWAKDEKAPDIPLMNAALSPRIRKDPLGCVLVIGYVPVGKGHVSNQPRQWKC